MCVYTTFIYSCDHRTTSREICNKPKQNKKRCYIRRLLCHYTILHHEKSESIIEIPHLCNICKDEIKFEEHRRRSAQEMTERNRQFETYRLYYEQNLQQQKQGCEMQRRARFFCCACMAERRNKYPLDVEARAANSGLCCARGIDEFEARYADPSTREFADESEASQPQYPLAEQGLTVGEEARRNATAARTRYSLTAADRGSAQPDPGLFSESNYMPGNNSYSPPPEVAARKPALPRPVQPRKRSQQAGGPSSRPPLTPARNPRRHALPLLQKALPPTPEPESPIDPTFIDWTRWGSTPQTHHGRLPPPPSDPLPQPAPVRNRLASTPQTPHRPLPPPPSLSCYPPPAPVRKQTLWNQRPPHDNDRYPHFSPVSPLDASRFEDSLSPSPSPPSSSWTSPWSSTSSLRTPGTVATKLEGPINRELNRWLTVGRKVQRRPLREEFVECGSESSPTMNLDSREGNNKYL